MPSLRYTYIILAIFLSILSNGNAAETKSYVNITSENCLKIGVPANSFSEKFVKVNRAENTSTGFCISVFEEVIRLLKYEIYYDFVEFVGTYDDLVSGVANKTFDAAVGDITIMAQRWTLVEFSEPFTESGLAMVVPMKPAEGWIFLKPFTTNLWIPTGGILVYTMFVVWFLEHQSNPEFSGPWKDQLKNAMWFTFSSLFFAHKERINRSHTRVVVVVWLFVVLILTQSYTASLTSMLTVKRLNPNIDALRTENAKVGCDDDTFMKKYVQKLGYKEENIKLMGDDKDYLKAFKDESISTAFLEILYAKLFVNECCKEFTVTGSSYRFGGLSFAFQKGSGMAYDVSEAILKLSENGVLKKLEETWLTSSFECTDSNTTDDPDSLSFQSFWILYLFSAAISTLIFLLFVVQLVNDYRHYAQTRVTNDSDNNTWTKFIDVVKYLKNADPGDQRLAPSSSKVVPEIEMLEESDYVICDVRTI